MSEFNSIPPAQAGPAAVVATNKEPAKAAPRRTEEVARASDKDDRKQDKLRALAQQLGAGKNTRLRIEFDRNAGKFVYFSINTTSGKVENQYPTESILNAARSLHDPSGLSVDKSA